MKKEEEGGRRPTENEGERTLYPPPSSPTPSTYRLASNAIRISPYDRPVAPSTASSPYAARNASRKAHICSSLPCISPPSACSRQDRETMVARYLRKKEGGEEGEDAAHVY